MLAKTFRMTENLMVLTLLAASAATMHLAAKRSLKARARLNSAWPLGQAEAA